MHCKQKGGHYMYKHRSTHSKWMLTTMGPVRICITSGCGKFTNSLNCFKDQHNNGYDTASFNVACDTNVR